MVKQTYIKHDLIDYVDGEVKAPEGVGAGSRVEWIVENLPRDSSVQFWREGGYQGKLAFVIRLDGYLWLFNDYYGSCTGCDAFMQNEKVYVKDMLRDAYCFESEDDALEYMNSTDDYSWDGVYAPVKVMIEDRQCRLQNPFTRFLFRRSDVKEMEVIRN